MLVQFLFFSTSSGLNIVMEKIVSRSEVVLDTKLFSKLTISLELMGVYFFEYFKPNQLFLSFFDSKVRPNFSQHSLIASKSSV